MTLTSIIAVAILLSQAGASAAPLTSVARLEGDWSCGRDRFDSCGVEVSVRSGQVTVVSRGRMAQSPFWTAGAVIAQLDAEGDLQDSSTLPSSWRGRETVYFPGRLMSERSGRWSLISTDLAAQLTYYGDRSPPYDTLSIGSETFYRKTW